MSFPKLLALGLSATFVAAVVAVAALTPDPSADQPAGPYQPGARQLAVLSDIKDYDYPGARFTADDHLVVYLRPGGFRLPMLMACQFGQRAGLTALTVVALDETQRENRLGSHRCTM